MYRHGTDSLLELVSLLARRVALRIELPLIDHSKSKKATASIRRYFKVVRFDEGKSNTTTVAQNRAVNDKCSGSASHRVTTEDAQVSALRVDL